MTRKPENEEERGRGKRKQRRTRRKVEQEETGFKKGDVGDGCWSEEQQAPIRLVCVGWFALRSAGTSNRSLPLHDFASPQVRTHFKRSLMNSRDVVRVVSGSCCRRNRGTQGAEVSRWSPSTASEPLRVTLTYKLCRAFRFHQLPYANITQNLRDKPDSKDKPLTTGSRFDIKNVPSITNETSILFDITIHQRLSTQYLPTPRALPQLQSQT